VTPLVDIPAALCSSIRAVLFDIDDTITLEGSLPACAYQAIEGLHDAGLITIPITGRPAGWCDHIARLWPVDGVVGENGAFYFRYDRANQRLDRGFWDDEATRRNNRDRLQKIAEVIRTEVPAARLAADQPYRESDLAIDVCEDIPALSSAEIERIQDVFKRHGATAKLSSIHVNGWFGAYDKCTMALRLLQKTCGDTPEQARREVIYVGDSPNDAPMFKCFPNSVGVANIKNFADQLEAEPRWITARPGGLGFAEFADTLLEKS
jgi:HAD superfamily hydrolase (TIGR01484 family)